MRASSRRASRCKSRAPPPARVCRRAGDFSRQRLSDNGLFPPQLLGFTWYNQADLGLQASYTFDWWGKQRDAVEAAMDEAHAAQAERSAAALMLASSVADTYFGWQADQSRIALARERESTVEREKAITAARIRAELDSADEAHRARLGLGRGARTDRRFGRVGDAARRGAGGAGRAAPATELPPLQARPLPAVDGALPDDVEIDLISRRADITASRWRVEAAEKNRESARAEFFPDVSINALIGVQSVDVGKLLEYGSRVPSLRARRPFADLRCGPPEGALRRNAGGHRFGRRELSGHPGRRRARCGDPGIDPRADRRTTNAARDRGRRGAAN